MNLIVNFPCFFIKKSPFFAEKDVQTFGLRTTPSQSDFTGGCGISPHRLLGLLDLSVQRRHHHRLGYTHPRNRFATFILYDRRPYMSTTTAAEIIDTYANLSQSCKIVIRKFRYPLRLSQPRTENLRLETRAPLPCRDRNRQALSSF